MCVIDYQDGIKINVKVTPRSSKNEIIGKRGDRLAIKLTSPPVEGRANKDLVKFLAKKLGVPSSSISILKGDTSRDKILYVKGMDSYTALMKLGAFDAE